MLHKTVDIKEAGLCFEMIIYQDVKFQRALLTKWLIQKNEVIYLRKFIYSSKISFPRVLSEDERQDVLKIF